MQHPDEGTIHAWLDGALPATEVHRLEQHVAECRACAEAVAQARGLMAASSRILGALDVVPANVLPTTNDIARHSAMQRARTSRRWWRSPGVAAAAMVLLAIGVTTALFDTPWSTPAHRASSSAEMLVHAPAANEAKSAMDAQVAESDAADARMPDAPAPSPSTPSEIALAPEMETRTTSGGVAQSGRGADAVAQPQRAESDPATVVTAGAPRTLDVATGRTAIPRLPVTPDTMRLRIAAVPPVDGAPGEPARLGTPMVDTLAGRVAAATVERPRAERRDEADPLAREAVTLNEGAARARRPAAGAVADAERREREQVAPAAPTPPPAPVAAPSLTTGRAYQQDDDSLKVRLVLLSTRVDSTFAGVIHTAVYSLRPGIEITYRRVNRTFRISMPGERAAEPAVSADDGPGERTTLRMDLGRVQAIHWTDAAGIYHSLSGAVEQEELQRVRVALRTMPANDGR